MRTLALSIGLALSLATGPCLAQTDAPAKPFATWLVEFKDEARTKGISQATLDAAFKNVAPIPRVIELDRSQPEFTLTFQEYLDRVAPPSRVEKGRRKFAENREALIAAGKAHGVQPRFIAALWGIETDFGRTLGGFSVIASLATLAHDGRRSEFFRGELLNALTIIDQGHISADEMIGSWAGAMGQSQFMPSIVKPGDDAPAYVVYDNFRVILKWNRSTYFGLAVGILADRIGGR